MVYLLFIGHCMGGGKKKGNTWPTAVAVYCSTDILVINTQLLTTNITLLEDWIKSWCKWFVHHLGIGKLFPCHLNLGYVWRYINARPAICKTRNCHRQCQTPIQSYKELTRSSAWFGQANQENSSLSPRQRMKRKLAGTMLNCSTSAVIPRSYSEASVLPQ